MRTKLSLAFALGALVCFAFARIDVAGADGTAPARLASAKGPKIVTLGKVASQYGPVVFDHAGHVEMAGGCSDCHHQHGGSRAVSCKECHPLDDAAFRRATRTERFRSCGECHPASLSPSDLSRPALKAAYHRACFRCHREVGGIGEDPKGCTEMCHEKKKVAQR
ncbi:MAG TPA: cytochrome c3 family protein [Candidatus Deferrimicrobiaceae bacterium]|nr:cytochrome c3 family protein [Candidatus Deferrimicrobiaceae bacterium]